MDTPEAVDRPIDQGAMSVAREAANAWASLLGATYRLTPLPHATNRVWQVLGAPAGPLVLKQLPTHPPGVDAVTEYRVLCHLVGHGVTVACPLVTDVGTIIATVDDRRWQLQPYLHHHDHSTGERLHMGRTVGAAIGHLDRALAAYPGAVESFTDDPVATLARVAPDLPVDLSDLLDPLSAVLEEALAGLPRQLTHGDCHAGNVLVGPGTEVAFIDLDHLPRGPRIRDLAYYLANLVRRACAEAMPVEEVAAALPEHLDAYHESHPVTPRERAALVPLMLLTQVAGAHWALHGWTPDPDIYRQNLTAVAWMTRQFHRLAATAAP